MTRNAKLGMLLACVGTMVAVVFARPPIPQPPQYNQFSDSRSVLGIPNGADVLSNAGFLIVAVIAAISFRREKPTFIDGRERWAWIALFFGVGLTFFGSSYFHLAPDDARLVWDRLPMSLGFMGLLAAIIGERVNVRVGDYLLLPLLGTGLASVLWWQRTNDLRLYVLVQFGSLVVILLLVGLFPARYTRGWDLFIAIGAYAAAKVFEAYDGQILRTTGFIGGHAIKHLAAAFSVWWLLRMLEKRGPTNAASLQQAAS